jgi:hypothetical protein
MSLRQWLTSGELIRDTIPLWGVRSAIDASSNKCRLNVSAAEVVSLIMGEWKLYIDAPVNISGMVDQWVTFRCNVWQSNFGGLHVEGVIGQQHIPWREALDKYRRLYTMTEAIMILREYLNENSYDDLMILLDKYTGHVVELSCLDRCYGTVPHRNAIVWECRLY